MRELMIKGVMTVMVICFSSVVFSAVPFGECQNVKVEQVRAGLQYGTMISLSDSSCGQNGNICIHPEGSLDEKTADRILSISLAAQASKSNVNVRWHTNANEVGCVSGSPLVYDFRIMP